MGERRKPAGERPATRPPGAAEMLEAVVGCKRTIRVMDCIRGGTLRPGEIRAGIHGLTHKVLNERLRKLVWLGLVTRTPYPEVPPRVEYRLTPLGRRFAGLLDHIESFQAEIEREASASKSRGSQPAGRIRRKASSAR